MRRIVSIISFIGIAGVMISGCSSEECLDNKNALPLAGFYSSLAKPQAITVDSLEIYGIGAPGDSILSDGSSISELYLPFRIDSDTTTYVIRYLNSSLSRYNMTDTIRFVYERDARFVSSACGVSYLFNIKDIYNTTEMIDSVVCPGMQISNAAEENIKIYFRVSNGESEE